MHVNLIGSLYFEVQRNGFGKRRSAFRAISNGVAFENALQTFPLFSIINKSRIIQCIILMEFTAAKRELATTGRHRSLRECLWLLRTVCRPDVSRRKRISRNCLPPFAVSLHSDAASRASCMFPNSVDVIDTRYETGLACIFEVNSVQIYTDPPQ